MKVTVTYDDTLYQLVPKDRKLIGWRTENFLHETSDHDMAKNWEPNIGILPIFEGDPNTALSAAPTPPAQPAERKPLTDEEITKIAMGYWLSWEGSDIVRFARHIMLAHGIKGES